jgi:putative SOS response-associated peptidase YedK
MRMCGRVRLADEWSEIKIRLMFAADAPAPNIKAAWNIPPSGELLTAIRAPNGARLPQKMRFGLIPNWAKDAKIAYSTFNARADSLATKPAFNGAWRRGQRCLVVTDGYYEWRKSDRQAFAIGAADGGLVIMAGIWETWRQPGAETVRSCAIVTTEPNALIAAIHDRMPVILDEADWGKWLGEEKASEGELIALLRPCPVERLKLWPVSAKVGNVRNDGPDLAEPSEVEAGARLL